MPADIYVYCPAGEEEGLIRGDLEYELEEFFGEAALVSGGGGGLMGFHIDFELADGQDVDAWVERLKVFLVQVGVRPSTFFTVYPDGWEPGTPWRRVEVFGTDRWLTEKDAK